MFCEICGKEVLEELVSVRIEGSVMKGCKACARHGETVLEKKGRPQASTSPGAPVQRIEKTMDMVEDYARLIRENREKKGLTQDQLGSKINEKGSVISRIESGHMMPDLKVAKKLEKFFSIKLLIELEG